MTLRRDTTEKSIKNSPHTKHHSHTITEKKNGFVTAIKKHQLKNERSNVGTLTRHRVLRFP